MSDKASHGIAYLTIAEVKGSETDEVQASGVLVAPDELLTASHVVVADDGGLRTVGTVDPGYAKGASSQGTYRVDGVHTLTTGAITGVGQVGEDLALIHLDRPVTDGTVFAMSSDLPATPVTIGGYPAEQSGALSETVETLTRLAGLNASSGGAIDGGRDAHGESGGPVWGNVGGLDTVYGVVSWGDSTTDDFADLTSADIARIEGWTAADHAGTANGDRSLLLLARAIAGDASNHPAMTTPMDDVARALTQSYRDGYTGGSAAAATLDIVSVLQNTSPTPLRDAAYAAGLFAAEEGTARSSLFSSITATFGDILGTKATRNAAAAGYSEGVALLNP